MSDKPIIQVKNLSKTFKTYQRGSSLASVIKGMFIRKMIPVEALKGISFSIERGEMVGFLGPNGAGKSTTLKILTGILYPTEGDVDILGFTPWKHRRKYVARIGAVFGQKSQLLWDIPPRDAFLLNRAIYDIPKVRFQENLERMIELLEVEEVIGKPTRVLSLGERMKCEFIMAMLHDPEIVLLDEPTIGLDIIAKERIRQFVKEMNAQGTTFILTTHDLEDVEQLVQRIILINHGDIVFDDGIQELRRYFGTRKRIRLLTERAQEQFQLPGLEKTDCRSVTDGDYELDLALTPLPKFIDEAHSRLEIRDISVEEIPIESVIRVLYGN